jgi:predicted nucleotidyltransferase
VSEAIELSAAQIGALTSMCAVLAPDRWSLIGASAIRCRLPLPRPTADVDFVVIASSETITQRLDHAGWKRHPKKLQTWIRAGAAIDVVPTTDDDLLAGVTVLEGGFVLSVVGFDLAFIETDLITIQAGLTVPVPRLPVLILLKMVAWLERPHERRKDLGDIVFIWDSALSEDDDRRWEPSHPVVAAALDYGDQSAFFCGWQLGQVARPEHLHWAKRFIDTMRDSEAGEFAQLVSASRYAGDDVEARLRSRLTAFERALEIGAAQAIERTATPPAPSAPPPRARTVFSWGSSGSVQMLLHDAIDRHRVVRFDYNGRPRIAEPHVLGTKDGRLQILTWQTDGASSSGPLPDWRRFFVDELARLELTDETFSGPRLAPGRHSSFDRQIAVVR